MRKIEEVIEDIKNGTWGSDIEYSSECEALTKLCDEILEISKANVKGDLISRSALLAELYSREYSREKHDFQMIIANQPTVSNDGWIACSRELPPQPKENPLFEYKPLEVYLVSLSSADYPWRAFWNGKYFTDGFSKVEPIAWMSLPAPYKEG